MNTNSNQSAKPLVLRRGRKLWMLMTVLVLMAFGIAGCFRVDSDARALRNQIDLLVGDSLDEQIEFRVGPVLSTIARFGLSFIDHPPELSVAMKSIDQVGVGIYILPSHVAQDTLKLLAKADQTMQARGWDRLVGVVQRDDTVAIYTPSTQSGKKLKLQVMVIHQNSMVLVSAKGNPEPLLNLVLEELDKDNSTFL